MNFGEALELMKDGKTVARERCKDKRVFIDPTVPNVFYVTETTTRTERWTSAFASHDDLLATDWHEVAP